MKAISARMLPVSIIILAVLMAGWVWAADLTIEIEISPKVLNLANQGEVVTVHTNLDYDLVAASTVSLNGVAISHWTVDNQGNFVAKFAIQDIKNLPGLVIGGYNTLTLTGYTQDGTSFVGSDQIKVIKKK